MANIDIGSTIRRLRKQKGISQKELSSRVVDVSTLSRIERGLIMPSKFVIEALFGRLGQDPNKIAHFYMTGDFVHMQKIIDKIDTAIGYRKSDELEALISQLENDKKYADQPMLEQYVLYAKGTLELIKQSPKAGLAILEQAIRITVPDFAPELIPDYLLTVLDRRIVITLAVLERNLGNIDKAVELYYGMKNNYNRHVNDRADLGGNYTVLLFNLVICLTELKRFDEVLSLCQECRKICIETGYGFVLPSITCYKAIVRHELKMDGCCELFKQSYYGCVLFELHKDSEFVKKAAMERLRLELV